MHALVEEIHIHPTKDTSALTIPPGLIPTIARLLDLNRRMASIIQHTIVIAIERCFNGWQLRLLRFEPGASMTFNHY